VCLCDILSVHIRTFLLCVEQVNDNQREKRRLSRIDSYHTLCSMEKLQALLARQAAQSTAGMCIISCFCLFVFAVFFACTNLCLPPSSVCRLSVCLSAVSLALSLSHTHAYTSTARKNWVHRTNTSLLSMFFGHSVSNLQRNLMIATQSMYCVFVSFSDCTVLYISSKSLANPHVEKQNTELPMCPSFCSNHSAN
jgi:hypothetical protein